MVLVRRRRRAELWPAGLKVASAIGLVAVHLDGGQQAMGGGDRRVAAGSAKGVGGGGMGKKRKELLRRFWVGGSEARSSRGSAGIARAMRGGLVFIG